MAMHQRSTDSNWLKLIGSFTLADLVLLGGLIIWIASPHPDTEARAAIANNIIKIDRLDQVKEDKSAADADRQVFLSRLDDLKARMERIETKMDQTRK